MHTHTMDFLPRMTKVALSSLNKTCYNTNATFNRLTPAVTATLHNNGIRLDKR